MYKLLLSWRYLRSRYIALASIVSVTLGVATMIVVNAVMAGFSHEMQERMHGVLSDLVFEARSLDGAPDAERHMKMIRQIAGDQIAGMSPTVRVPAMLGYYVGDQYRTQQIMMIGVDEETYAEVSDFGIYLQHPENRERLSFDLKAGGYDTVDPQSQDASRAAPRSALEHAGWPYRRHKAELAGGDRPADSDRVPPPGPQPPAFGSSTFGATPSDPFAGGDSPFAAEVFDPSKEQHTGVVLGMALAAYRSAEGNDVFLQLPGDDVEITYPSAGRPPKPLSAKFTVVDFYESKMQEYDASFCFVPLRKMQELR
ncbi:MAG: ABC transporter permease, partial [Planctomycetota bacterium]